MNPSSRKPYRPILTTDADVTTMWRSVIDPLGWHDVRLYAAGRAADIPMELLHVGTDTAIVPVPLDEVLPRSA